jgi:hypothetical protein
VIYFIQDEERLSIKIGHAEGEVAERLRALQTGNPAPLVLLGCVEGNKADEAGLHGRFAGARERNEWFRPVPSLIRFLMENAEVSPECVSRDFWTVAPNGAALLADLRRRGFGVSYRAGRLRVTPDGELTEELRSAIRVRKAELIRLLHHDH